MVIVNLGALTQKTPSKERRSRLDYALDSSGCPNRRCEISETGRGEGQICGHAGWIGDVVGEKNRDSRYERGSWL